MKKRIILASSSPRRRELLEKIGLEFIVDYNEIDESFPDNLSPAEGVELLSFKKAQAAASKYNNGVVIGSDTIVVLDGEVLGKPAHHEDAYAMLNKLQGSVHEVISGIAVLDIDLGESFVSHEITKVKMRSMSEEMILRYIEAADYEDKAGSYAIQELGAILVERIEGDYFNVVGLPLYLLSRLLEKFDIKII